MMALTHQTSCAAVPLLLSLTSQLESAAWRVPGVRQLFRRRLHLPPRVCLCVDVQVLGILLPQCGGVDDHRPEHQHAALQPGLRLVRVLVWVAGCGACCACAGLLCLQPPLSVRTGCHPGAQCLLPPLRR
jgi:hypothetical protein